MNCLMRKNVKYTQSRVQVVTEDYFANSSGLSHFLVTCHVDLYKFYFVNVCELYAAQGISSTGYSAKCLVFGLFQCILFEIFFNLSFAAKSWQDPEKNKFSKKFTSNGD